MNTEPAPGVTFRHPVRLALVMIGGAILLIGGFVWGMTLDIESIPVRVLTAIGIGIGFQLAGLFTLAFISMKFEDNHV